MNDPTPTSNFRDALERHQEYRRELEKLVLPLASSLDGRRFSFQAPLRGLQLEVGGYVVLEAESVTRLGQVVALREDRIDAGGIGISLDTPGRDQNIKANVWVRHAGGEGEVLDGDGRSFVDARVRPARPEEVGAWVERAPRKSAGLAVGTLALAPGVPFPIRADGFARHTFFCGQSGSGKTYSLGAILEQLLLETELRIIVLDPNSDFVRLHETRPEIAPEVLARYSSVTPRIRVRQVGGKDGNELYSRASDLSLAAQAAALRLDPIRNSNEYESLRSTF